MPTFASRKESLDLELEAARRCESTGDPNALGWYLRAAVSHLSIAIKEVPGIAEGEDYLREEGFLSMMEKLLPEVEKALVEAKAGRSAAPGGNYPYLAFAHACWLLDRDDLGSRWIAISCEPCIMEVSTKFWQQYAKTMQAFAANQPCQVIDMKLRAEEQFWVHYLHLMQDLCHCRSVTSSLSMVEEAFRQRNAAKRESTPPTIEPSGLTPAVWDFRKEAILRYARRHFTQD